MLEFWNGFRCVTGCHSFHRFFWLHFSPTSGSRQAPNHDRTASVGLHSQDTRVVWSLLSTTHHKLISAPRRRRSAEQPHGSFVVVKTQASSRTSGHRARVIFTVLPLLVFPCSFASGTARARSFCTHERSRTTESTVFEHIHHKDRRQLQLFQRLPLRRGRASFVTSVNTDPRGLPLRGFLSHHGIKTTWAMAFPRINCRTTTATVLTATATVTLSLRACLFLCYIPITSPSAADSFYFLKLLGTA